RGSPQGIERTKDIGRGFQREAGFTAEGAKGAERTGREKKRRRKRTVRRGMQIIQRPDRWLETPGFAPYLQAVSVEPANLTGVCRAVRCPTTGLRIPISLSGNSTSSTARVRRVGE